MIDLVYIEAHDASSTRPTRLFRASRYGVALEWCYAVDAMPDPSRARWYHFGGAATITDFVECGTVIAACVAAHEVAQYFATLAAA